jgi:hypothetical protein
MNVAYPSVRRMYVLQRSMCPTAQKQARPKTKAWPRSYEPGTPQTGNSLRGVLLARNICSGSARLRVLDRDYANI